MTVFYGVNDSDLIIDLAPSFDEPHEQKIVQRFEISVGYELTLDVGLIARCVSFTRAFGVYPVVPEMAHEISYAGFDIFRVPI